METKYKVGIGILSVLAILATTIGVGYSNGVDVATQTRFGIVSETEYWSGETGMAIARFVDWQGDPISVINCTLDVLYPNDTWFIQGQLMSTNQISGDHYGTFQVPATEGIYDYSVECFYTQGSQTKSVASSKTFHVSPALNFIKTLNSTQQDILDDLADLQVNVSNVYTDTNYIRDNMVLDSVFESNMTEIYSRFTDVDTDLTTLMTYCDDATTNSSALCQLVYEMDTKIDTMSTDISSIATNLDEINQTTHSTYDYMTGTLATNVGTLLTDTGILKTTTTQINTTLNSVQSDVTDIGTDVDSIASDVTDVKTNTSLLVQRQEEAVTLNIVS